MDCPNCSTEIRPGSSFCHECGTPSPEPLLWPKKPWIDIWLKPRGTIRAIVNNDPERYVIILAILFGVTRNLDYITRMNEGDSISLIPKIIIALFGGAAGGMIYLFIGGAILRWSGSFLGGQASSTEVRAAIAWSSVPMIFAIVLWIPNLALYGMEMSIGVSPQTTIYALGFLCFAIVYLVLGVWASIILFKTLGEVHGFSAWKGLGAVAMPTLAIAVSLFGCYLLVINSTLPIFQ